MRGWWETYPEGWAGQRYSIGVSEEPASNSGPRKSRLALIGTGIAAYFFIAFLALPLLIPPFPRSLPGWLAVLLAGPPLLFFGEWIATKLDGSWGERNRLFKAMKMVLFILVGFCLVVLHTLCTTVFRGH